METDITLVFLKYLIEYDKIDIEYLDSLDKKKFKGSNIHKLVANLCVNYINLKSNIMSEKLRISLGLYRNFLVHCEGSVNEEKIKSGVVTILKDINKLNSVKKYSEYDFMIYWGGNENESMGTKWVNFYCIF